MALDILHFAFFFFLMENRVVENPASLMENSIFLETTPKTMCCSIRLFFAKKGLFEKNVSEKHL